MATPGVAALEEEGVDEDGEGDGSPPVCEAFGALVGGGAKVVALSVCMVTSLSSCVWWGPCCWGEPYEEADEECEEAA